MEIYLLRHGIAEKRGSLRYKHDYDRPLTAKGKDVIKRIAKSMQSLGISFDCVISSPYVRARQTAEIVCEQMHIRKRLEFSSNLEPGGDFGSIRGELNTKRKEGYKKILLTGHEPYLSEFIGMLIASNDAIAITMKKGGLCELSAESKIFPGCASIESLLTPKQLCKMR